MQVPKMNQLLQIKALSQARSILISLKSFQNDPKLIDQYLSSLSTKELLETAAEMANEGAYVLSQDGMIIVKYLEEKWASGVPIEQLDTIIKDKTNNKEFRAFLIDWMEKRKSDNQIEAMVDTLLSIGVDKTEDENLRQYAFLKLRKLSDNPDIKQSQYKSLESIFYDSSTPPTVKGAILTTMRRTGHPNLQNAINSVMSNSTQNAGIVLRHAVVAGVKSKQYDNISQIKELSLTTQDPEVYGTMVYALGLINSEEAVKAIVSVYGRFNNRDIGNYALESNQKTILSMLDVNKPNETIVTGITAANLAKLPCATDNLQALITYGPTQEIRNKAQVALNEINATPKSAFPSNSNKWED